MLHVPDGEFGAAAFLDATKPGAYYVSVGRGASTDTEALMAASQKLGEKAYAEAQAAQAAAGAETAEATASGSEPPKSAKADDDNVVDADFKEVKK